MAAASTIDNSSMFARAVHALAAGPALKCFAPLIKQSVQNAAAARLQPINRMLASITLFTLTFVGILSGEGPLVDPTSPTWFLAGAHTENYRIGFDKEIVRKNKPSLYLKSKLSYIRRDGTVGVLMKNIRGGQYVGKRVRFSGYVKTDAVQGWADLWIGVNNGAADVGSNVSKRIKGTRDWKRYEIVAKVPPRATNIAIGIFLVQAGTVWLSDPSLEVIESEDCDDHGPISARRDYDCWLHK